MHPHQPPQFRPPPPGFPVPGFPVPGFSVPGGPEHRPRKRRRIVVATVVVTVLAAIGATAVWFAATTREPAAVETAITRFADAMDRGDLPGAVSMMCAEEAQAVLDDEDYDPEAARSVQPVHRKREIRDIRVDGTSASAEVVVEGISGRVGLRKEQDHWVMCTL